MSRDCEGAITWLAIGLIVVCGKADVLMETSGKLLSHYRQTKLSAESEPMMRKCSSCVALVPVVWGSPLMGLIMPFADEFKHTSRGLCLCMSSSLMRITSQAPSFSFVEWKRCSFLSFLKFFQSFSFPVGQKKRKRNLCGLLLPALPLAWSGVWSSES